MIEIRDDVVPLGLDFEWPQIVWDFTPEVDWFAFDNVEPGGKFVMVSEAEAWKAIATSEWLFEPEPTGVRPLPLEQALNEVRLCGARHLDLCDAQANVLARWYVR